VHVFVLVCVRLFVCVGVCLFICVCVCVCLCGFQGNNLSVFSKGTVRN
jgi:hypothetical protein